jgi:hypothetical protein
MKYTYTFTLYIISGWEKEAGNPLFTPAGRFGKIVIQKKAIRPSGSPLSLFTTCE